jgi:ABC-2 type transport system permease protein
VKGDEGRAVCRQIAGVARRDLRIQLTHPLQLATVFMQIPFVLFTYFFLDRLVGRPAALAGYGGGYFEFALVGFVVMSLAGVALAAFSQGISSEQRYGTLEIVLASPGARLGPVLVGSLVVPVALAAAQAVVFFAAGFAVAQHPVHYGGLLLGLPLLFLTVACFCAFGVISAAVIVLSKRGDPFSGPLLQATSLISGAVFPVLLLPGPLRACAHLFPAYYGFQGLRELLLNGAGLSDVVGELGALAACCAVLLPFSLFLFSRAVRLGRTSGVLGSA